MGCCGEENDEKEQQPSGTKVRGCTDVFWLCLYIVFWIFMILIAVFSFVYGNPLRIINGYDSFGNTCGSKSNKKIGNLELSGIDTSDKPYLVFFDITELRKSLKICVKQCPNRTLNSVEDINKYYKETGVQLCQYDFVYKDFINKGISVKNLSGTFGPCPTVPVYESQPVLNRCVPKPVNDITRGILSGAISFLNDWDTLEQILGDLYDTWGAMVGLTFLALVVSLFTVSILHLLANLVSYIIMVLVSISSVLGTAFLWYTYFDIKHKLDKSDEQTLLLESIRNETAFFWYSIIATVITIIILILVIVIRKRVDFLANLFKETSKCLAHIPALFFQPVFTFCILLGFFFFWLFVVLCLATSYYPGKTGIQMPLSEHAAIQSIYTTPTPNKNIYEKPNNNNISFIEKFTVVEFIDPSWVKYMWWVYFIGLIWTSEYIMACQQMVIAGSVAHWFYRHKYKDNSHVTYAISKLIKYHLGSVAKGSLLLTIFKVPRIIMMWLHAKLSSSGEKGNECAKCGLKTCICCFYCLEKFIRYLNHNAYTVIAIDGASFCSAAKTAFEVLLSNALQVATINSLGDFILFLGKCFVTAVTGSIGLYIFRNNPDLTFYAAPTLLVCIFAFFVAHCILSLYEMVLDTVYLCMCQSGGEVPETVHLENLGVTNGSPQNMN